MPLRLKILLTYATGIALLWVGVLWLRHVYPASKFTQTPPAAAKPVAPLPSSTPVTPQPASPTPNEGSTPQARVEAYIREWFAVWQKVVEPKTSDGAMGFGNGETMEQWGKAIRAVDVRHFSPSQKTYSDSDSLMGTPPAHHAGKEGVTKVEEAGDTATVTTELNTFSFPEFYKYKLTRENGVWYIRSVALFFSDETEVAFTEADRAAILAKVTPHAKLPELDRGVTPNCDRLFEDERKVTFLDKEYTLRVRSGGRLSVPSGVLGVRDFGYSPEGMRPLTRRLAPGNYDLECSVMEGGVMSGTVAAARLILDKSSPAATYRPAPPVDSKSHYAGVDAGNVAFFDAGTFMNLTKRGQEEHYQDDYLKDVFRDDKPRDEPTSIHLGNPPSEKVTCIVVSSGMGDGAYPCYWGLDAQGKPVSLVVDFLVLAEFLTERCKLPWPPADTASTLTHPTLEEHEVSLHFRRDGTELVFEARGGDFSRAIWRSAPDTVAADTKDMGYNSGGGNSIYRILQSSLKGATELEVELHAGHRN